MAKCRKTLRSNGENDVETIVDCQVKAQNFKGVRYFRTLLTFPHFNY